jgi:hypothetical protein
MGDDVAEGMTSLAGGNLQKGKVIIVRPSKLEAEGKMGLVASGILEKTEPNKFDPTKKDYFIRGVDDTLYIINETATLKQQLGQDGVIGLQVEVHYNGKKKAKKSGKDFHDFECFAKKA